MNELAILLSGAMTTAPAFPSPYETLLQGFSIITNSPIIPGPGITLTNGWITIHPERRTGLPGTPREGEVLTTEEVALRPCFAAVDPACPGHLHTNLTRWRWTSGAWSRVPETNATIFWAGTTLPFTNFVSTNVVDFQSSATNVTIRLPEVEATHQKLSEILQKVREALKP